MEANTQAKSYGQQLKAFRKQHDVSRKEFCAIVGCTPRTLDRWESDITQPLPIFKGKVKNALLQIGLNKK